MRLDLHEPAERFRSVAQSMLRIAAGVAYFSHGTQKLFGWFGGVGPEGGSVDLMTRFGAAGVIESSAGLLLILGLFTRPAALIASGEMAVAYFWMHWGQSGDLGWWQNKGEVVMLYSFIWLLFAAWGGGRWSVDAWVRQRRAAD